MDRNEGKSLVVRINTDTVKTKPSLVDSQTEAPSNLTENEFVDLITENQSDYQRQEYVESQERSNIQLGRPTMQTTLKKFA